MPRTSHQDAQRALGAGRLTWVGLACRSSDSRHLCAADRHIFPHGVNELLPVTAVVQASSVAPSSFAHPSISFVMS